MPVRSRSSPAWYSVLVGAVTSRRASLASGEPKSTVTVFDAVPSAEVTVIVAFPPLDSDA